MYTEQRDIEATMDYINTHFGPNVVAIPASDGVALAYEAKQGDKLIARIYNSYSRQNKPIHCISFTYQD